MAVGVVEVKPVSIVLMAVLPGNITIAPVPVPERSAVPITEATVLVRLIAPNRCPGREGVKLYCTVQTAFAAYTVPTLHAFGSVLPVTYL